MNPSGTPVPYRDNGAGGIEAASALTSEERLRVCPLPRGEF